MVVKMNFWGLFIVLVILFKNGVFDEVVFCLLVNWQIFEGINGFVLVGIIGESLMLSYDEYKKVVEWCIVEVKGCVLVVVGVGFNLMQEVIEFVQYVEKVGVDVVFVVMFYYNKLIQEGMYQYFKVINDVIGIFIIIYNILLCLVIDMLVDMMKWFWELKNIVGVKDVMVNMVCVLQQCVVMGEDFNQFLGEDVIIIGYMVYGGYGCILVMFNVVLCLCLEFYVVWVKGDIKVVLVIYDKLMLLYNNFFIESNLVLIKYVMLLFGKFDEMLWLLMVLVSELMCVVVCSVMVYVGLIN